MKRRNELDAVRGLAALSVLVFHILSVNSSQLALGITLAPVEGWLANVFTYSPLHVIWLGSEAVWLFFVLSGFVLSRSASRPSFECNVYFPSRLVRLYLPVFGAILFAWVIYLIAGAVTRGDDVPFLSATRLMIWFWMPHFSTERRCHRAPYGRSSGK
ncbi:hypothetical protein BH09ACT1_BH09ACT1_04810 [soil metagenome]